MLIVVRHGRTPANAAGQLLGRRDPELDELGRAQAAAVGIAIPTAARVISSPLMRCRQTAEAIGTSVEIDERLIEVAMATSKVSPSATFLQPRGQRGVRYGMVATGWRKPR